MSGESLDREVPGSSEEARGRLDELRQRIGAVDEELIRIIGDRRDLVLEIGRVKSTLGLPVMDPGQEAAVVRKAARRARSLGVDEEMTRDVLWRIIAAARAAQEGKSEWGPPPPPEDPEGEGREGQEGS